MFASNQKQQKILFATRTPSKSNSNAKGLYHKKTHGQRFQRCFSMKKSIITKKPNIKSKNLKSDILNRTFKINISTKARKCIMKAGSLDKYLLNTKPQDIDSKFGLYLRDLIKQKSKNPKLEVPYIPGTARLPRSRKTTIWEYHQMPAIYMPAHARATEDQSKYYLKTPQEMSRFEIADLEQQLREIDEPEEFVDDQTMYESQEFAEIKQQMKEIQPLRHGIIKRYFMKYRYQKKKREDILEMAEDAEELTKQVLGDEYVHFKDAIPEIKEFLVEIERKEKENPQKQKEPIKEPDQEELFLEEEEDFDRQQEGVLPGQKKELIIPVEDIDYDPRSFNPFDVKEIRKSRESEKPLKPRKVLHVKK